MCTCCLNMSDEGCPVAEVDGFTSGNVFEGTADFSTAVSHILHPHPQRKQLGAWFSLHEPGHQPEPAAAPNLQDWLVGLDTL